MLWDELARKWDRYKPPLCPADTDVAQYRAAIAGADAHVLLLGVTPQLAGLGQELTALDGSVAMIEHVWPGDTATRRAIQGDWRRDIPAKRGFSAVMTDGGFIYLRWPDEYVLLLDHMKARCAPGFRLVMRGHFSENVQPKADLDALFAEVRAGATVDPEIAKHRIAHSLAARSGNPNVSTREQIAIAQELFAEQPDIRQRMISRPHAELDLHFSFPTRPQIVALLEDCGFRFDPAQHDRADAFVVCTAP